MICLSPVLPCFDTSMNSDDAVEAKQKNYADP